MASTADGPHPESKPRIGGVDLDLVFLGTAGSMPTAQRAPAALLVRRGGERLLFDCAEGTQRQLLRSAVGLVELREVFITHFHADHVLGLPGMLKTFGLRGREHPLEVYGPSGLVDLLASLKRVVGKLTYELRLVELEPGDVLERDGYRLATFGVSHGVPSLGWSLIEATRPGRFDVDGADLLGVPNGPERGALQRGEPVSLADGRTVTPEQVDESPRAVDLERDLASTQGERLEHPRQAEDVIGVEVRDEDLAQLDQPDDGTQQLPLGSLRAVEEQALAPPADEQRRRRTLGRRHRARGAEEDEIQIHRAIVGFAGAKSRWPPCDGLG